MIIKTRLEQRLAQMKQMEFMFPKHIWSMYLQQDVTDEFFEDIAWALATGSNRSFFTTGDAGIGKSLLTANIGQIISWIAERITGQRIPFTVEGNLRSDTVPFINMLSNGRSYHSYLLDEVLTLHGQGSQITLDSMKNIMKASARFEQINWAIVGIELLPMHVYNYVLRAEAKDYDETNIRKSKAFVAEIWQKVWEDLYGNYMQIGKIKVPIVLTNSWIDEYHLKQKAPKVTAVLREEGLVEAQGLKDVYNRLYGRKSQQS